MATKESKKKMQRIMNKVNTVRTMTVSEFEDGLDYTAYNDYMLNEPTIQSVMRDFFEGKPWRRLAW